jgi:hypothetical protein
VKGIIQAAYKQNRHEDDVNQALSVQPWGSDSDKRRYYLIEGLDDTHFRVYRESNFMALKRTWFSVAGDIDELKALAEKLDKEDRGQKARTLSSRITAAIPRFEATEDVRITVIHFRHGTNLNHRSGSDVNTVKYERISSSGLNLTTQCMRDEREASG